MTKPIIIEERHSLLDEFNKIFESNPLAARVYAFDNRPNTQRVLFFDESKTKFQIIHELSIYGVSITMEKYFRAKRVRKIFVNNGKFYFSADGKKLKQLAYYDLDSIEKTIIYERYPWIRMFEENIVQSPFNIATNHKLYSLHKLLSYIYKCPFPQARLIHAYFSRGGACNGGNLLQYIKNKTLINLPNTNKEILFSLLGDTLEMAWKLNMKVDASWSLKRLTNEHDRMSRIITDLLYSANNKELVLRDIFRDFAEFSGFALIHDTKSLSYEGMTQKHCVASYASSINSGHCAIYHVDKYTLELRYSNGALKFGQCSGYQNCIPVHSFTVSIKELIDEFNKEKGLAGVIEHGRGFGEGGIVNNDWRNGEWQLNDERDEAVIPF